MEPRTIGFCQDHEDTQAQGVNSAESTHANLRPAALRTGALLFLSSAIAVFAVTTTAHLPPLWAEMAIGKLLAIVGFNLFAGYMLVDALAELRSLLCLRSQG